LSTPDGDAERDTLFSWGQKFVVSGGGEATLEWSPPLTARALQLFQILALVGLIYLATRRSALPTPQRRRQVDRPAEPLVVVDSGDVLEDWTDRPPSDLDPPAELSASADPGGTGSADPDETAAGEPR
ncbi:MAG: hypothetical protein ACR2OH_13145, partial [Microthrixaceae bacterium]